MSASATVAVPVKLLGSHEVLSVVLALMVATSSVGSTVASAIANG